MMKRGGNFGNSSGKKIKLDDLWDDDLDSESFEDCFRLATQVYEAENITNSQVNNVTQLPTYSAFKPQHSILQSTQIQTERTFSLISTKQNHHHKNNNNIGDSRIKLLQEKCAEKEGEVSILRANLKELKTSTLVEQERRQTEWSEKFNVTMKEMKSIKSELDFKNLEIANLKQRLAEVSKCFAQNQTQRNTQIELAPSSFSPKKNVLPKTWRIHKSEEIDVPPLQYSDFSDIFKPSKSPKASLQDKEEEFLLTDIYPDILFLLSCDLIRLESHLSTARIDKIVGVAEQFLHSFHTKLRKIESEMRLEEIQHWDSQHNDSNNKGIKLDLNLVIREECEGEIGIKSGKVLTFLGELLQHSRYFQDYIFPRSQIMTSIFEIISIIGKTRQAYKCPTFLSATLQFITNGLKLKSLEDEKVEYLTKFVKELILTRPPYKVVVLLPSLLKIATLHTHFALNLCSESKNDFQKFRRKGGMYGHCKESCTLQVFVSLFDDLLSKIEVVPLEINKCLLSFIGNLFNSNVPWLYYTEGVQSECLYQLYELTVKSVHKNLQVYKTGKFETECPRDLIKMSLKIFNLLTFNSYNFTEKYPKVYAQYRDVLNYLITCKEDFGLDYSNDLKKLDTYEEMSTISCSAFDKILDF